MYVQLTCKALFLSLSSPPFSLSGASCALCICNLIVHYSSSSSFVLSFFLYFLLFVFAIVCVCTL